MSHQKAEGQGAACVVLGPDGTPRAVVRLPAESDYRCVFFARPRLSFPVRRDPGAGLFSTAAEDAKPFDDVLSLELSVASTPRGVVFVATPCSVNDGLIVLACLSEDAPRGLGASATLGAALGRACGEWLAKWEAL